jgi:hypothetical protein
VKGYSPDKAIKVERKGFFGQCDKTRSLKFLEDQQSEECGYVQEPLTSDICTNRFSALKQISALKIAINGDMTSFAPIIPGV